MFKDKKVIVLLAVITFELLAIITISVVRSLTPSGDPDLSEDYEESEGYFEYCQIYEDEECEGYEENAINDSEYAWFEVDPEVYGESFLYIYSSILKGEPISEDQFSNFTILSEYYSDEYTTEPVSSEILPTTYYASSYKTEGSTLAYPGNLIRRIALEIPSKGCAVFDFSADFHSLNNYSYEEGTCNGTI